MGFYSRNGFGRGVMNLDPMSGLPVAVPGAVLATATGGTLAEMMQAGLGTGVPLVQTQAKTPLVVKVPEPRAQIDYQMTAKEQWEADWWNLGFDPSMGDKIAYQLRRPLVGPIVLWHALAAAGVAGVGVYAYRRSKR